ncbi:MAG: hypothetical protein NXI31_00725 [bacterium]|nr:hypothetical protein [bacterium]
MTYRSNVTERVYVRSLGYRAHRTRQETVYAPSPGEVTLSGAVAFDADANRFLLAYGVNGSFPGGLTQVDVFEHPAQIPPVLGGLGCSSATIAWGGSTLIGDDDCGVELSGLPAGALTTVMVATQPFASLLTGTPMVHPGCWLLVPNTGANSIGTLPIAFGPNVRYQVDLPEWLGPMTLHFQGVHFDAAATEVFTTQRLSVSFVK